MKQTNVRFRFLVYLLIALVWGFYLYLLLVNNSLQLTMNTLGLSQSQVLRLCVSGMFFSLVIWVISLAGAFSLKQFAANIADSQVKSGFRRIAHGLLWLSGWLPTAILLVVFYLMNPGAGIFAGVGVPILSFLHTIFPVIGLVSIFYGERQISESHDHLVWLGKDDTHLETIEQQERALAQRAARSQTILENMAEGLVMLNVQREVMYVNDEANALLKCKSGQLNGTRWPETVEMKHMDGKPIDLDETPIFQLIKTRKPQQQDVRVTTCDGTTIPVSVLVNHVEHEGEKSGYLVLFRDLSEQEALEHAKTEFVSLASHQLRTPIASVRWMTEVLLDEEIGSLNDRQREYIQNIRLSGTEMSEMVNDFLNVSNIELEKMEIRPEPIDLRAIAENALDNHQEKIKKKELTIKKDFDPDLPEIVLDRKMIGVAIGSLIANAVTYTDKGGAVDVSIEGKRKYAYVDVRDDGCGIPEADQARIFEKFFRASNARTQDPQGTGLGLYLAKAMIERLGGDISFDSQEGEGSEFHLKIPLSGVANERD
jgi:PAS domain S-box-containing protein